MSNRIYRTRKIYAPDELQKIVAGLKATGKTVVQSHGVFDIVHPGMIQHLTNARKMGDVLVVTVIADQDVRRGPGRPVFPEKMRAENVAALETVDYVAVVGDAIPFESVTRIQPDIFAKGQAHRKRDKQIHQKVFEEERELYFGKIEILETSGFSFSASQLINNFLDIYPDEVKAYIEDLSTRYSFKQILDYVNELRKLKVLLIGDGIIDEYHYCHPMGKSAKAQLVVNKFLTCESFAGGVFAIANHLAGVCDNVTMVTLLGDENSQEDFIRRHLKPNIRPRFFYRQEGPTIVKKRYVDSVRHQKLFEINYLNDNFISGTLENDVVEYLEKIIPEYDLVMVSDFGHGLITTPVIEKLQEKSRSLTINTQTNGANTGFNMITRYRKPLFTCLDETEARLSMQMKKEDIRAVGRKLLQRIEAQMLIITTGKNGALGIRPDGNCYHVPIFSSKVIDTVGAGDAFFSFTAPCAALKMPLELIVFIGNAVGAIAVQIMGNKRPVEKYELLEFIRALFDNNDWHRRL